MNTVKRPLNLPIPHSSNLVNMICTIRQNINIYLKAHQMKARLFLVSISVLFLFGCYGQRPQEEILREKEYTTEQWLEMITRPEHQPIANYQAVGPGKIRKNGCSMEGGGFFYSTSPSRILEYRGDDLLRDDPMMFLPALASKDRNVILTGMYLYKHCCHKPLTDQQNNRLAEALRKLLLNPDTAIKVEAFNLLAQRRFLKADDIIKGLSDYAHDVRYLAALKFSSEFLDNAPVYTADGKFHKGNAQQANDLIEQKRKLAPVLLQHLNESSPFTRDDVAWGFYNMFRRKQYTGKGVASITYDFAPKRIDWIRASWHEREKTKKIWTKWWNENGEKALKFAHPPQG